MKTKSWVKYLTIIVAVLLLAFAVGWSIFGTGETNTASAATMPRYKMTFAYTHYLQSNATTRVDGSSQGTTSAYVATTKGYYTTVSFSLFSSTSSGDAVLPMNGAITERNITIKSEGSWSKSFSVSGKSSGSVGSTKNGTLTLSNLADDTYTMSCSMQGGGWNPDPRSYASYSMTAYSTFIVDTTAPSISGASTSTTGKSTNTEFTVSATDSGSGVENLYMKTPQGSTYTAVGTSKTITSTYANGLYSFYAKDNAGNTSATYYVFYDTTLPTLAVKNASGAAVTSAYINTAFSCTASDTGSGVNYIQYITPSNSSWATYKSGTSIPTTSANGKYQFRAVDKAGNISAVKSIIKDTEKPTGTIYGENTAVATGGRTKAQYIRFQATDTVSGVKSIFIKKPNESSYVAYTQGTQFTTNGSYSFYCSDNAGNKSVTYTAILDNTAPILSCTQANFYNVTANDFTVKATDAHSTLSLYYKTPLMTEFAKAGNGSYSVTTLNSDGKYYFYAEDALGNRSETKWIELKVAVPTATVEQDTTKNHYRITWEDSSTGRLNDTPYIKGTWITKEGEYTFVITNSSNRANTYHFTIAHSFVVTQVVKPTCTEKGYSIYKCLTCDVTYNSDYVNANGHSYTQELIGENCQEGAHYLYTCSVCKHQYKSEYLTAGGHKYDKKVVAATCTERGYTIKTCTVCAYTFREEYTAALGHNFKITVLEPTCTEGGHSTFECKRCDYEYVSDYTPAKGHSYEITEVVPTCTDRGYKLHKCSACEDEYKTDETFALGHSYTERTQEVSCTQNGCILHTCTRCGYEYETNVTKALGHKYVSEVTMTANCTEDGNRHHICSRCGEQYDTPIPAFGHNYEITDIQSDGGVTIRKYSCTVCGHSYTQDLGDQYEEVSNYVEYLFQQYAPYMWWVFLAVAGVWSIAMGIAIIVAHKHEDKYKAKKMLVNYLIGMVVIAVIVIACPYLVRGIASLIAN